MKIKKRLNIERGVPWEPLRGYSRAVQVGDTMYISGTGSLTRTGEVIGIDDPYEQTRFALETIRKVLAVGNFSMRDIVRVRLYLTKATSWDVVARAHRECFENIRPALTIVQVERLADPRLLVEIEVDAVKVSDEIVERIVVPE
jgi:enamine deaminase RidA (YjgF/YER057c/UK114 family)